MQDGVAPDAFLHALRATGREPTIADVKELHAEHLARMGEGDAIRATRTEIKAILTLLKPPPSLVDVTDAHRLDFVRRKETGDRRWRHIADPLHMLQQDHGERLWLETDALVTRALDEEQKP